MVEALTWTPESGPVVIVLLVVTVTYTIFHFGAAPARLEGLLAKRLDEARATAFAGMLQKVLGFVLLGLVPLGVTALWLPENASRHGLQAGDLGMAAAIVCLAGAVFVPVNILLGKTEGFQKNYPQIRIPHWSSKLLLANAASWALYLVGYEFFFRGFFLFSMVDGFGVWPAIMITTAVYVAVHLPKNAAECFGCIPMGIVFAAVTLATGAVWAAVAIHILIAVSGESAAIVRNPRVWKTG
jgi:membrane protease YdiL (CAAX protease family)